MPDAAERRQQAQKCRDLAEQADDRTAANLRMLADEYEREARLLESRPSALPGGKTER